MALDPRRLAAFAGFLVAAGAATVSADPKPAPTFIGIGMGEVAFLRFSPNGKELVRISQFGPVEMFATDGYDRMRTFDLGMRAVTYSPDARFLATAEGTDGARVWDATQAGEAVPPEDAAAAGAAVTDIHVLRTALRVLEPKSSDGASSVETRADKKRVLRAEFSPDGSRCLTAQVNGHVKVRSTTTWAVEADLATTSADLYCAVFSPDGKSVFVGDADGGVHEWSLETQKEVRTFKADALAVAIDFTPSGEVVGTLRRATDDGAVVFWKRDGSVVETKEGVRAFAVSRDGKRMALGGKKLEFVDPASRKTLRAVELQAKTLREANPRVADAAMDGGAADPDMEKPIPPVVSALAFSPDGVTLAAGCIDGSIRLVPTAP